MQGARGDAERRGARGVVELVRRQLLVLQEGAAAIANVHVEALVFRLDLRHQRSVFAEDPAVRPRDLVTALLLGLELVGLVLHVVG